VPLDRLREALGVAVDHRLDQLFVDGEVLLGVEELVAGDVVEPVVDEVEQGEVERLQRRVGAGMGFRAARAGRRPGTDSST